MLVADERSVVDRLDDIESMLKQMNSEKKEQNQDNDSDIYYINRFIKTAKKEHYWFGSSKEFTKCKKIANRCFISLIIVGVISSILSSIAFQLYSTFTLFENIWLIFAAVMFYHTSCWKKIILDFDLAKHSNCKFVQNKDGTFICTTQEKKKYCWTRRISYIAVFGNIIGAWTMTGGVTAFFVTVFELAFLGLSIGSNLAYFNLFRKYGLFVFFTNRKLDSNELVTLVFDGIKKKLISMEEFNRTYNNIDD